MQKILLNLQKMSIIIIGIRGGENMQKDMVDFYRRCNFKYFSEYGQREDYPPKFMIGCGGVNAEHVYLILGGRIRQYFVNSRGVEKTMLLLSKGDMFGEVTALQRDMDQVATQTLTKVSVRKIPVASFEKALRENAELSFSVAFMLSYKIRILMPQIQDASFCNTEERLKNLLIRLSVQQGVPVSQGIRLPRKYTHEELANMISSTRSTVSRIMKGLAEEGFIKIIDRYIYLS